MTIATSVKPGDNAQPSTLLRWLKFNLVGGMGIIIQFAALFLLKSVLQTRGLGRRILDSVDRPQSADDHFPRRERRDQSDAYLPVEA